MELMEKLTSNSSISVSSSVKTLCCNSFSGIFSITLPNFTLYLALDNETTKSSLTRSNSVLLEFRQVRGRGRATSFLKLGVGHGEKTTVY